jgi:type II secretory pathway pseudopilin PulG
MKRTGTTLIEVLAAIFILALGLVALMTLFPLGAAQMARAIQDERAAQLAANSAGYCRWYWKNLCEASAAQAAGGTMMYESTPQLWFTAAMDDPNAGVPTNFQRNAPLIFPTPGANAQVTAGNIRSMAIKATPSFPVLVDPVGWEAAGITAERFWAGANAPPGITFALPRRTMPGMGGQKSQVLRSFFLLDDMSFDSSGLGIAQERVGQYSAAWLLRRDKNYKRNETNLTVVVYFKRSIETLSREDSYLATPTAVALPDGSVAFGTALTLHFTGDRPTVRRGSWILDATMSANDPQGFYYRVTDVGEPTVSGSESTIDVQLETPIRRGPLGTKSRVFLVQDRVLEVFDKGPIEMNSPARAN